MRVIGVIDLRHGRAVHARAGRRDQYQPVRAVAGTTIDGDAVGLVRAYVDLLGVTEVYLADLDALAGGSPNDPVITAVAATGAPVLLDTGVNSVDAARQVIALGAACVVVALETLPDFGRLRDICRVIGGEHVAFSLDLRNGEPMLAAGSGIAATVAPEMLAAQAASAGAGSVIVIDLARVGTGIGLEIELIGRVRDAAPGLTLLAGGGVCRVDDLASLADVGCDGALVATALHDGRIGAADVAAASRYRSRSR